MESGGFDETIQDLYEDQIFLAKICARFAVFVDSGCCDQYRQHAHSTSHLAIASGEYHPLRPHPSRVVFLDWLAAFLARERIRDRDLREALRRAFFPYRHPRLHRFNEQARSLSRRGVEKLSRVILPAPEAKA